jgi:predicted ribosome quality control (RQC) complex YloA/Tae2 family protein
MNAEKRPRLECPDPLDMDDSQLVRYVAEFRRRRQRNEVIVEDATQAIVNLIIEEECRALIVEMKREAASPINAFFHFDVEHDVVLIKDGTDVNEPPPDDLAQFHKQLDELTKTRKTINTRIAHLKRSIRRCEEAARREEEEEDLVLANVIAAGLDDAVITVEDIEP